MRRNEPANPSSVGPSSPAAWLVPALCVALGAWSWACQLPGQGGGGEDGSAAETGGTEAGMGSFPPVADDGNDDGRSTTTAPPPGTSGPTPGTSAGNDDDDDDGPSPTTVTREDVLRSIAHDVVVPAVEAFEPQATALREALSAYVAALEGGGDAMAARQAAQAAFAEAFTAWQLLEVMQVGPTGSTGAVVGGEGLRDEIYSWPTSNPCRVDLKLTEAAEPPADYFDVNAVNSYGLDAIEYLLFTESSGHACPTDVGLDPAWATIAGELELRRAVYAEAMAAEVARQAAALRARWSPAADDFAELLASPGASGSPYTDAMQALDEVFAAMFYVDKATKDAKLGRTLGIPAGCSAVPCVELLEATYSQQSAGALARNLAALQLLVQGGADPATSEGFDDLLRQEGHDEIATELLDAIADAIALLEGLEAPLSTVLVEDPDQGQAAYDAIKRVTDQLKGPFVMALRLTVPAEGAGDND